MNVLSLFDGISCGQIALERAGIKVDTYYASEVEPNPIKITMKNYPNTVQLGDVTKWKDWDIDWKSIDLLIGGSPCQGFSFAGEQLNFNDPRSKLFFEYVDVLNYIKKYNPNVKFLLENVKMKKEYQDVISTYLGVEPVLINSSLVSAQSRMRLYWSNINEPTQPKDKNIILQDILEEGTAIRIKSKTVRVGGRGSNDKHEWDLATTDGRRYTPIECERLQTMPDNYTHGIPEIHRYKAIGNGWTVDVIAYILSSLPNRFKEDSK